MRIWASCLHSICARFGHMCMPSCLLSFKSCALVPLPATTSPQESARVMGVLHASWVTSVEFPRSTLAMSLCPLLQPRARLRGPRHRPQRMARKQVTGPGRRVSMRRPETGPEGAASHFSGLKQFGERTSVGVDPATPLLHAVSFGTQWPGPQPVVRSLSALTLPVPFSRFTTTTSLLQLLHRRTGSMLTAAMSTWTRRARRI